MNQHRTQQSNIPVPLQPLFAHSPEAVLSRDGTRTSTPVTLTTIPGIPTSSVTLRTIFFIGNITDIPNVPKAFVLRFYPVIFLFFFSSGQVVTSFAYNYSSAPLLRFFISIAQAALSIPVEFL